MEESAVVSSQIGSVQVEGSQESRQDVYNVFPIDFCPFKRNLGIKKPLDIKRQAKIILAPAVHHVIPVLHAFHDLVALGIAQVVAREGLLALFDDLFHSVAHMSLGD